MNPHPVEAPPPFARHHRLCKRLGGVGGESREARVEVEVCFRGG